MVKPFPSKTHIGNHMLRARIASPEMFLIAEPLRAAAYHHCFGCDIWRSRQRSRRGARRSHVELKLDRHDGLNFASAWGDNPKIRPYIENC
jgi:hypothetical protein